jgi:hypothetical protein
MNAYGDDKAYILFAAPGSQLPRSTSGSYQVFEKEYANIPEQMNKK